MNQAMNNLVRIVVFGFFLLSVVATTQAQFKAGVQGTVTDSGGGRIPDASITLTNKDTNKSQTTNSSDDGFYSISGLPAGNYTLSAEKAGFKKQVFENVVVNAEASHGVDIILTAG